MRPSEENLILSHFYFVCWKQKLTFFVRICIVLKFPFSSQICNVFQHIFLGFVRLSVMYVTSKKQTFKATSKQGRRRKFGMLTVLTNIRSTKVLG